MRFALPARAQGGNVVVGGVFFDNVWNELRGLFRFGL